MKNHSIQDKSTDLSVSFIIYFLRSIINKEFPSGNKSKFRIFSPRFSPISQRPFDQLWTIAEMRFHPKMKTSRKNVSKCHPFTRTL